MDNQFHKNNVSMKPISEMTEDEKKRLTLTPKLLLEWILENKDEIQRKIEAKKKEQI